MWVSLTPPKYTGVPEPFTWIPTTAWEPALIAMDETKSRTAAFFIVAVSQLLA